MCGIAGIIHTDGNHEPPSIELLRSMIGAIQHRGPDEFGVYRDSRAGLAHARLSIIDLASGQQPLCNEDGSLWISFNGEVFNFIELRKELESLGHHFRTQSDTETIVHAYEAWGNDCFSHFNGQWAVALWDAKRMSLVLSRDRIGVRPLYIHESNGRILFASEVKAIFADPSVPRHLDCHGLDQTFTYWSSIAPTTPFLGIEELLPGSVRTYDVQGRKQDYVFWRPSYPESGSNGNNPFPYSFADAAQMLKEKLMHATKLRVVRADVPVGSYLSGGLDSSLVAWMGRQAKEGEFSTFSMRFEDAEYDETNFQRMMASTMDCSHRETLIRKRDIALAFPDVIWHAERPILRTAPAPLFLLSRSVRHAGIKAVLSGEGADEMLAGYDLFREAKIREFWSRQPDSKIRPKLFDRLYPYLARSPQATKGMALQFWKRGLNRAGEPGFSHEPRWLTTSALKRFLREDWRLTRSSEDRYEVLDRLPSNFQGWDSLAQAQYLEVATLLSSYLMSSQGDRMLMAHSVEGRFPFLDVDVMEFCNSLPSHYKLALLDEKSILKRVAKGAIPEAIINRHKQPYRAPDAASFVADDAPEYVAELLSEECLTKFGIFVPSMVGRLYEKCQARRDRAGVQGILSNSDNMSFVGILSTQLLFHQFIAAEKWKVTAKIEFTTLHDRTNKNPH